jgi:predicted Zn-dependent protease
MLEKLKAQQEEAGADLMPALLSSHPATADRIAEAARLAQASPCDCMPLAIDWAAVRADATVTSAPAPAPAPPEVGR